MVEERTRLDCFGPRVGVLGGESSSSAGLTHLLTDDGFDAVPCRDLPGALDAVAAGGALVIEQNSSHERLVFLLTEILRATPSTRVFVITPYGDTHQLLDRDGIETAACFPMPLVYEDLVAALRECLDPGSGVSSGESAR